MIFLPIKVATGQHTYLGRGAMINYDCDLMDQGRIEIGERTLIGPHCQLITIYHPLHAGSRSLGKVKTRPIKIGADCWIGAGGTIMGGGHWGFQGTNDAVISVSRDGSVTATGVGTAQVRLTFVQPNFEQVLTDAIDFTVSASRPTTSVAHPSWRLVD